MRAIDLYSGVGGWSLGLAMAGVEVVKSYEWWKEANLTNLRNNLHESECVDIRTISPSSLPAVDLVVGSPPCTQFSLANRGGKGDIMEGLKDVEKFLEIVDFLKPKFWAMENVPRLSSIMCREFNQGGLLNRFCQLNPQMMVLDMSEWGVPQRRQRLVVGNFNMDLLLSYRASSPLRTLGHVMSSLSSDPARDPVYGTRVAKGLLVDHDEEQPFSPEEERINRDAKTHHPVYNNMSFPDLMDKPSRTITATCTRISRESVVVPCEGGFRRPTLREQASIQSFPLDYQFYGDTHAQKQKMIGNAIPPLFAYHVAHAMLGAKASDLPPPATCIAKFSAPSIAPKKTAPDKPAYSFPLSRKFRFAVPNLRFKSGVRFELTNSFVGGVWGLKFFYGNSKDIREITLGVDLLEEIRLASGADKCIARSKKIVAEVGICDLANSTALQEAWNHSKEDASDPFGLLDMIGAAALASSKKNPSDLAVSVVSGIMASRGNPGGFKKLIRHAPEVFAGFIVCSLVNEMFSRLKALEELSRLDQELGLDKPKGSCDLKIDGHRLVRTCIACPEQYDVFGPDGDKVGYLRLRHGTFRADFPDCGGETVYVSHPKGSGVFMEEERMEELTRAVAAIRAKRESA